MTIPQANGLYVLKEISKRLPSASVISAQSHFVENVWSSPRGASSARAEAVYPCLASNADISPARAAPPTWNGLVIDPNCSRTPTGCDAAMPSAMAVAFASSARMRAQAAAAPSMPVEPVMCQPRS